MERDEDLPLIHLSHRDQSLRQVSARVFAHYGNMISLVLCGLKEQSQDKWAEIKQKIDFCLIIRRNFLIELPKVVTNYRGSEFLHY